MKTVVTVRVPAAEFALSTTFERVPDVEAEIEPVVESDSETTTHVVRMDSDSPTALSDAFAADASVERASPLSRRGEEPVHSYRIDWSGDVHRVLSTLTAADGEMLGIRGQHGEWRFELLYPRKESLVEAHERWTEHGLTVGIERIYGVDRSPSIDAYSIEI